MKPAAQYLSRYAEPEAQAFLNCPWRNNWAHALVIPAYDESAACLKNMSLFQDTLLILVLNHPDTDPQSSSNDLLRNALQELPEQHAVTAAHASLRKLGKDNHVLVVERSQGLPQKQGVGLARKIGCDIALALGSGGLIRSPWIHCSDADASMAADYFSAADSIRDAAALTYPFEHVVPDDARQAHAISLYERYLRGYVEGLARAGSPYAFHTIGSCMAVNAGDYAKVRGFPRLAAGEDFYLLNKIAKQGVVATPDSQPLRLSARLSRRTPFGTGTALLKLLEEDALQTLPLFYDPRCFNSLGALLAYVEESADPTTSLSDFKAGLKHAPETFELILSLGLEKFLSHASQQCADKAAFVKQFHQWFDGFKTLKFIHGATQQWPKLSADEIDGNKKAHTPASAGVGFQATLNRKRYQA